MTADGRENRRRVLRVGESGLRRVVETDEQASRAESSQFPKPARVGKKTKNLHKTRRLR